MVKGLTTANLGIADYNLALVQHQNYIDALRECGLKVSVLPADEDYPDSTFVEDTALLTPFCAIITNPGAASRKGEINKIREMVSSFYSSVEEIKDPGTVEAGDAMMVGKHYYIGISERTNLEGAKQLGQILEKYGISNSTVTIKNILHLKTSVAYLQNNTMVVSGGSFERSEFSSYKKIIIPNEEAYAANCIWINGRVLLPAGYAVSKKRINDAGYLVKELEMSEFQKLDGGLSCLSLRF